MKSQAITLLMAGLVTVTPLARVRAQETSAAAEESGPFAGHLELGTRITHFVLVDEDDDSFLGSIDHLGDEQDYLPYKLFADYLFNPYFGVELTYDRVEAVAKTSADDNHTDGNFVLDGPILTAFGRYPNDSICTPFAGAGVAYFQADFEAQDWWGLGYSSPADYASVGSPNEPRGGKTRELNPDDALGFVVTAGSAFKISEHWSADLYARYMTIETDVEFLIKQNGDVIDDNGTTTVPFDNFAFGAGVKYVF